MVGPHTYGAFTFGRYTKHTFGLHERYIWTPGALRMPCNASDAWNVLQSFGNRGSESDIA